MPNSKPPLLDLFGEPDINPFTSEKIEAKAKKVRDSRARTSNESNKESNKQSTQHNQRSVKKTAASSLEKNKQQAFLPGLSRRGRPRLDNPISAVARTAEHRRKRLSEGSKRVEMILAPEVSRQLDALAQQFQEPRSEVITTLIMKAYAKVAKSKPEKVSP